MINPPKKATCTVLCKTVPPFLGPYRSISVANGAVRDEYDRAGWELDEKAKLDKEEMATLLWVVVPESADGTPSLGYIR